jgi:dTDP-4-amino-4,6-dideoxygalactose transaminase
MSVRVPFLDLHLAEESDAIREAISRVIDRGWFVLGPEVEAFEQEFAAASGARHAVGVGNGTDALALILRALGIGAGHEVITTPLSAAYTAIAIVMAGARPVFADIDPERLTLDPLAAERAITNRTAALLPVHLYGQPADMAALTALARRKGLALVEDCCQAHLATCEGQPVGTFGAAGAFSFYPTKNLGALGDGGAVITGDASLAARIARLRNGGQSDRYHHVEMGVNSRLDGSGGGSSRAPVAPRTRQRRALAARYRSCSGTNVVVRLSWIGTCIIYFRSGRLAGRRRIVSARPAYKRSCTTRYLFLSNRPSRRRTGRCPHAARGRRGPVAAPVSGLSPNVIAVVAGAVRIIFVKR